MRKYLIINLIDDKETYYFDFITKNLYKYPISEQNINNYATVGSIFGATIGTILIKNFSSNFTTSNTFFLISILIGIILGIIFIIWSDNYNIKKCFIKKNKVNLSVSDIEILYFKGKRSRKAVTFLALGSILFVFLLKFLTKFIPGIEFVNVIMCSLSLFFIYTWYRQCNKKLKNQMFDILNK